MFSSHILHHSQEQAFGPVPQRVNFLWGVGVGQQSPPIKSLLKMVQDISLIKLGDDAADFVEADMGAIGL
ncbi:hypothetical protein [Microcoleus sp. herbarium2]|uniref:hypothetical protein n=1 Tax=Microcoleus sp. herbarium2 TaxID=3055433 RepID=UPI002FD07A8E